ncbi:hypothetical protein ACTXT7_004095 [Hymenolepis weldensis]
MEQVEYREIMLQKQQEYFAKHLNLNPEQSVNFTMIQKRLLSLITDLVNAKNMFRKDLADIAEEKRVKLLLWPLETAEHKKPNSYIRPKELSWAEIDKPYSPKRFC